MSTQKPGFRAEVREYTRKLSGQEIDVFNDFQKSQWMTRAYLDQVLRNLNPAMVPDDDTDFEDCFVDGPSDAGVDYLYRNDGHVLIIQSKYRGQGKIEEEADFDLFCNVLTRLHPVAGAKYKISARVRELASEINWDEDTFELHFVTLGRANENLRAREDQGLPRFEWNKGLNERADLTLFDESGLNERLREAHTAGEQLLEPVDVLFATDRREGAPWIEYQGEEGHISYIGYMAAPQLRRLAQQHKFRLFAQNIRNYVGDTSTNKGMMDTALQEPRNFFFYNNGVSAIATKIEPDPRKGILRCERFSIINGAQTVRSLAKAHQKDSARASGALVLTRITLVSLAKGDDQEGFLDKITRFNNTQNAVKVSDFRSNDPIQRGLAKRFQELSRGGKIYWYKNKRSSERSPRKIPIGMEEFAKTLHAFHFGPPDAFGGSAYLFDTAKDKGYVKVFGVDGDIPAGITESHFEVLAGTWFLCEGGRERLDSEKERLLKGKSPEQQAKIRLALERRWLFFFALGELCRAKCHQDQTQVSAALRRLAKPRWLDENGPHAASIAQYSQVAADVLAKLYTNAASQADFVHRNWFRSEETMNLIRNEIQFSSLLIQALPGL